MVEFAGIGVADFRVDELPVVRARRDAVAVGLDAVHVCIGFQIKLIRMVSGGERVSASRAHNVMRGIHREAHLPCRLAGDHTQVRNSHGRRDCQSRTTPGGIISRRQNVGRVGLVNPGDTAFLQILAVIGDLFPIKPGNARRHHFIRVHAARSGRNHHRTAFRYRRQRAAFNTRAANLACHIGMAVVVIVVVGVGDNGGALRIERYLEIIDQVPIVRAGQPSLRNIRGVNDVLRLRDLREPKSRIVRGRVERLRVVNSPFRRVIIRARRAVPYDSNRPGRRPGFHPRKHIAVGADIAHPHWIAPGRSLVGRML